MMRTRLILSESKWDKGLTDRGSGIGDRAVYPDSQSPVPCPQSLTKSEDVLWDS